jgi:cytoskeletal protein RodZ
MKNAIIATGLIAMLFIPSIIFAIEKAPRISDREIVERLTRLEEGLKALEKRIDDTNNRIDKRIDDLRSEMNSRFDTLQWMLGLFITIALIILGFVLRMQWQMHKRQTTMETSLETQKDEIAFLKGLIEKLIQPKSAL